MSWIFIAAVVVVIAVMIMVKLSHNRVTEYADYPYQKTDPLFSPAERSFYGVLNQTVGDNAKILGKVRVADVVVPKKGLSRSDWQKAFNKISGKHFDFLLCSSDSLSVICAIELDDSSHNSKIRQKRDQFLKAVCNVAEIPLIQVPAKSGYVIDEVKELIAPHIKIKEFLIQEEESIAQNSAASEKACPECSSPMVIRTAKKGANAGKQFWACSAFPKCKHIEPIQS